MFRFDDDDNINNDDVTREHIQVKKESECSHTSADYDEDLDSEADVCYETDKDAFKFRREEPVIDIEVEERDVIVDINDVDFVSQSEKVGKKDFSLVRVIGKGAYGKVFLVQKISGVDNGMFYAMKVLKKAHIVLHDKDTEHTKTERTILEEVRHPFIVRLFYAFQTDHKLYLILDFAPGGELFHYLEKQKMLLEDTAMFYMAELTLAIEHLHSCGIVYRDLKPENVLLDRDGHIKLTDFGLSKVSLNGDKTNTVCGTIEYMAPEILANVSYDKTVDWWSLGALSFDMMTGSPPFTSNNRKKTIDMILNKKLSIPYFLTMDAKDLLTKLMRKSSSSRPSVQDIRKHRFFKPIKWDLLMQKKITPPIVPSIASPDDVNNFHSRFTNMPVDDSPVESTLTLQNDDIFKGFSFVAKSVFNDNFTEFLKQRNKK